MVCEILAGLGVSYWTLNRRMKEWGLPMPKPAPKIRVDGYWGYGNPLNHRRIMEKHLGRILKPHEGVHHLDLDKANNDITNLFVTSGTSEHRRLHNTLEECAGILIRKGTIRFDHFEKRYKVTT